MRTPHDPPPPASGDGPEDEPPEDVFAGLVDIDVIDGELVPRSED